MKLHSLLLFTASASLLFNSCTKNTNDEAVSEETVTLKIGLAAGKNSLSSGNTANLTADEEKGKFTWTGGQAMITNVKLESKGNFKYELPTPFYINLMDAWNALGQFEVPVTTVDSLSFTVELNTVENFPSLQMQGSYERAQQSVPLSLTISKPLKLTAVKNSPTTFSSEVDYEAALTMALEWLAEQVTDDSIFFNAEKENGVVVITETKNVALYQLIWNQLNEGTLTVDIDKL